MNTISTINYKYFFSSIVLDVQYVHYPTYHGCFPVDNLKHFYFIILYSPTAGWVGLVGSKETKTTCIQGEYLVIHGKQVCGNHRHTEQRV